jgi:hypothetical protein
MSTLGELTEQIREDFLDDVRGPEKKRLWSKRNIAAALAQSQREIARRCLLIQDSTTNALCFLPLATDPITGHYPQTIMLSPKVLRIRFVLFPNHVYSPVPAGAQLGHYPLVRTNTDFLNAHHRGGGHSWIGHKGRVERYMTDFQLGGLTFDHQPDHGGTVQIGVIRLPLADLRSDKPDDELEIREYDLELIHGALKYLYSKGYKREDTETHDPIKESRWRNEFEADIKQITQDQAAMQPRLTQCHPEAW